MAKRRRLGRSKPAGPSSADTAPATAATDRWRPWFAAAACALFVAQPLAMGDAGMAEEGNGLVGVMLWIVLAASWSLVAWSRRRLAFRFGWTDAVVVVLVAFHTLAAIVAATRGSPRPAINMLWVWVGFALSFFMARQVFLGRREIRAMLVVMIAMAVALSGYCVYQRFHEMPASWTMYIQDPVGAMRAAGVSAPPGSPEWIQFEKRLFSFEPLGTFSLTNSLAGYLAPWLVVAAGIGLSGGLAGRKHFWSASAAFLAAMAIAACTAWTKSRSAYLAVLIGLPAAWWVCQSPGVRSRRKMLIAASVAAAVLAGGVVAATKLDRRILTQASLSLGYRMQYWRSTMAIIGDHPIVGCGPGQFQSAYTAYKLPEASEEIAEPHNFVLEVWATAGTPALLGLLAMLGFYAWALGRGCNAPLDDGQASTGPLHALAHIFGGAALGFLAAVPLSLAGSTPTNTMVVLVGLPLAAATVAGFYPWIVHGRLDPRLLLVGLAVLLIDLLAAGGIGFPGVCGTFWLLLALGLNAVEDRPERLASRKTMCGLLAGAVLLMAACYWSAYGPVLACRWRLDRADEDPARAEEHLTAAASADPWAAVPWNRLAGIALLRWRESPTPQTFAAFERYQDEFLKRTPNSATAAAAAAERYDLAFERSGEKKPLEKAVSLYHQAVEHYPNDATLRAKLAVALRDSGDQEGFDRESARAIALDAATPHADKKLPDKLREALQRNILQRE